MSKPLTIQYTGKYANYLLRKKEKVINDLLKRISDLEFEVEKQDKEIERLNIRLKTSNDTCNYLRNTIDKAIEYIDRRDIEWGSEEYDKLLNILKGVDKE